MRKLINLITGLISEIALFVLAIVLGLLIYNELHNFIGIIIFVLLGLLSVWLGINIFKKVQSMGIFDFISVVVASPDLDNLEPIVGSTTKKEHLRN